MKKSGSVGLVLIATLGLSSTSCSRTAQAPTPNAGSTMRWDDKPRDPCSPEHFQDETCKTAVNNRGYHYGGHWFPMVYALGYRNYYDNHRNHLARGGTHSAPPSDVYSPRATPMSNLKPPSSASTQRGGFGSTARSATPSSSTRISAGS